jgi:hypothetical protein
MLVSGSNSPVGNDGARKTSGSTNEMNLVAI